MVIMPSDVELFEISAGGVPEPKADWTATATRYFRTALQARKAKLGIATTDLEEKDVDDFAEVNALHGAVARAIAFHHFGPSMFQLPTKEARLDWSMGDSVQPIKQRTGADYALFTWVRDSYASSERVAMMIGLAILGIGVGGGVQIGYASLVDLNTGQIVWFNRLVRGSGDLREPVKAAETVESLLEKFPGVK